MIDPEYGPTIDQVLAAIEKAEAWQLECEALDAWMADRLAPALHAA